MAHDHHGHSHGPVSKEVLRQGTSPIAKWILVITLLAIFAITVFGVWQLLPSHSKLQAVKDAAGAADAPGVTYESATVTGIAPHCDQLDGGQSAPISQPDNNDQVSPNDDSKLANRIGYSCIRLDLKILTGPDKGWVTSIEASGQAAKAGLVPGDTIMVMRIPSQPGEKGAYSITGINRNFAVILMFMIFIIVTLIVSRWKGFFALLGLAFAILVVVYYMLPALVVGESGLLVGLTGAIAIMYVVVYVAHGFSFRTSAALLGTIISLVFATGLGILATYLGRLSGLTDESQMQLSAAAPGIDFRSLLVASMIVASLGVLNDVTITQSSAVWELRVAGPQLSRFEVFKAAMRIGCDHIASSIYTIVFAYAGAALSSLLLLVVFYRRSIVDLLSYEVFSSEVLRTLASATGLVLSVPITTALAVAVIRKAVPSAEFFEASRLSGAQDC